MCSLLLDFGDCSGLAVSMSAARLIHSLFALIDGLLLGHARLALATGLTLAASHAGLHAPHSGFGL